MVHDDQKTLFHRCLIYNYVYSIASHLNVELTIEHFGKYEPALTGNKNENSNNCRNISIYVIRSCWSGFWNLSI